MPRLFAISLTTCLALAATLIVTLPARAQDNPVIARMTAFGQAGNASKLRETATV